MAPGQLDCQSLLSRLQVPIYALLAFCGNHSLTLTRLDIRGVHINTPTLAQKDFSVPWRLALLVFGSAVRATVEGARVFHNVAGSAIAVANAAEAEITGGSILANNRAGWSCSCEIGRAARRTSCSCCLEVPHQLRDCRCH